MPKPPRYEVQQKLKPLNATSIAFVQAYARDQNLVQAAVAAGFPMRMAISGGMAMLVDDRISRAIASHMRARGLADEADQFLSEWGLIDEDEPETLFDRIAAAREKLALEARDGLPLPAEIEFIRKPPSRRQRRAQLQRNA